MAIFAISFRIGDKTTNYGSYADRWSSVDQAIKESSTGTYWNETTSFYLVESNKNSAGLAEQIDQASSFDASVDLLVCINLSQNGYKILGAYSDKDIDVLMKKR
ncbi:hypothetical protein [Sinorhizobium americanum]|uniref:Uncharacterized protein n=1 Tax=Sinorhizobium americanum TaxID=194963 RepID=A0A4R2BTP0_9HYPH|nr:hypothetical protein [Sinorhizobium americanum]TCN30143.1 hypothetical protein EV184_1089 [Sinorhizobium americanum]